MKRIVGILVFGFVLFCIMNSCKSDGVRSFYCLSKDKCVTVWKPGNGDIFIIYGTYRSGKIPTDDYVKLTSMSYGYISVILSKNKKLLIDVEKNANIMHQSSNGFIELYRDNKELNDSIYTYSDGRYRRYKKGVDYINIDIKENYATDKTGKKI
jgi:hypothetical protein